MASFVSAPARPKDPARVAAGRVSIRKRWGPPRVLRLDHLDPVAADVIRAVRRAVELAGGGYHNLVLESDGRPALTVQPYSQVAAPGAFVTLAAMAAGVRRQAVREATANVARTSFAEVLNSCSCYFLRLWIALRGNAPKARFLGVRPNRRGGCNHNECCLVVETIVVVIPTGIHTRLCLKAEAEKNQKCKIDFHNM